MSFSGLNNDSPKKMKQGSLIPFSEGLSTEQGGNLNLCRGRGSSSAKSHSEYIQTKRRNRLRLHDRKSINNKDGWAEQGGYMNAKHKKLADQFKSNIHKEISKAGESTNIFQGVSIYVNGYTNPSSDELKRLMMLHGGLYQMYLSKERVTHIIATNLPDSKIISLRNYKVIHPDWILKSIEAGRLLSYTSYQLFTSQSKLQRGIMQFSVATDKNQNSTTTICKSEASSSVSIPDDKKIFQTRNTVSPTNEENNSCKSTVIDFPESPQSCHSDDLFLSSFDESSQESKKSQKAQESITENHLLKSTKPSRPEQTPSPSLYSDIDDNEMSLSSPSEMKTNASSSASVITVERCETEMSSLDPCSSDPHKTWSVEECQDQRIQEEDEEKTAREEEEAPKKSLEINHNSKPSTSRSDNKPLLNSSADSFTKITIGVHKGRCRSPPNAKTAREPNYLNQFYNNSRLHHLSTWKVEWKNYVSQIKTRLGNNFPGRIKLKSLSDIDPKPIQSPSQQIIMHIDMDSFFVSVALRDKPELKDKPVGVTHSQKKGPPSDRPGVNVDYERQQWIERRKKRSLKGKVSMSNVNATEAGFDENEEEADLFNGSEEETSTGNVSHAADQQHQNNPSTSLRNKSETQAHHSFSEIASCNYIARKAGLRNGMFIGDALKLCPNLITLPYEFEKYQEVSKILYDTVASYTHDIEAVSCDEMFVDCTNLLKETGVDIDKFVSVLRQEIFEKTGCTASAGLGPNILLARLATHKAKPNNHFLVQNDQIADFIKDQTIKDLPGVGRSMMYKLEHLRVKTCGELQNLSLSTLQHEFGSKTGQLLYNYCRGKDNRPLQTEYNQKSVSAEINYGIRFKDDNDMNEFLKNLSSEVESRLKKGNKQGKTISLKLMVRRPDAPLESAKYMGHGLCNNHCKSVTLPMATDKGSVISQKCMLMYKALKLKASDLRGIGISINRLESTENVNSIVSHHPSYNILKFAQTIPVKNPDSKKSSPTPSPPPSLPPDDFEEFLNDTKTDETIQSMKPLHVKRFGTIDFKEEISRQKKSHGKLPPLPRLPSQGTLAQLQSLKVPSPKPESEYFLPSPSQVDADVLNELPADIRHQIQEALKEKQKKKNKGVNPGEKPTSILPIQSDQPGCSHWTAPDVSDFLDEEQQQIQAEQATNAHDISDIERELLPNLSQVDESCFNELPEDIQQEMRRAMKQREIRKQDEVIALSTAHGNSSVSSPVKMVVLRSPTKDSSPIKSRGGGQKRKSPGKTKKSPGKKWSPHFKVPRGRPRTRRGMGTRNTVFDARKKLFLYGNIDKKYPDKNTEVITNSDSSHPISQIPRIVSLCGAVTIGEVRKLLQEWLITCSDPTVDDELFVIDYLKNLIKDKNLEQVDLVLKFLYRNVCHLGAENWKVSLENIVQATQRAVMAQYNSKLKLGFSLPIT